MTRGLPTAAAWVLAVCCGAVAAAPDTDAAERQRIAAERQAVEARYAAARKDCEARFVVNQCLDQARQARRAALEPLQRQIHLLDDARRRERAVERLRVIQERQSAAADRPALAKPSATDGAASAIAQPPSSVHRAVRPPPSASAAAQVAQQRQAQQQQRLKDAQSHQEAVQSRNARQDAHRPPAAGLPVPGASAP
jgi:colicin import membrane protein